MGEHNRWLKLFAVTRLVGVGAGVVLILAHEVPEQRYLLAVLTTSYGVGTVLAAMHWRSLQRSSAAWAIDAITVLTIIFIAGSWRSPFYVLGLTALIFPATSLPFRRALAFGAAYSAGYFFVAAWTGVDWETIRQTSRLEGFSTHLLMPIIIVVALAHAARLLREIHDERERSELLAVEAERRRIAWELHDSAKQRVHAAHLVLSQRARQDQDAGEPDPLIELALGELRAATTDIDTSLTELQSPLAGRGLADGVRTRAAELERASGVRIEVAGDTPALPSTVAAHIFRVVGEAMTNAVRHARAGRVRVRLEGRDGSFTAEVSDDGRGLPDEIRPGSNGVRSMQARAEMLGGQLELDSGDGAPGTTVRLDVPLEPALAAAPPEPPPAERPRDEREPARTAP